MNYYKYFFIMILLACNSNIANNGNEIKAFIILNRYGEITGDNIKVKLSNKVDVRALAPIVIIDKDAKVNPESGVVQDFTNPILYEVSSKLGLKKVYKVTVESIEEEELISGIKENYKINNIDFNMIFIKGDLYHVYLDKNNGYLEDSYWLAESELTYTIWYQVIKVGLLMKIEDLAYIYLKI